MTKEYKIYLQSSDWKIKRKKVIKRDNYKCTSCGSTLRLEVHHKTYKNIFNENLSDLVTLCHACHYKIHNKKPKKQKTNRKKYIPTMKLSRRDITSASLIKRYKEKCKTQLSLGEITKEEFRIEMNWITKNRNKIIGKSKKKKRYKRIGNGTKNILKRTS